MSNRYELRLKSLRRHFGAGEAVFVNDAADVFYLTGFTGDSSCLIVLGDSVYFITDGRYTEQISREASYPLVVKEIWAGYDLYAAVSDVLRANGVEKLVVDKSTLYALMFEKIAALCENTVTAVVDRPFVKDLRMVKDEYEIEVIRRNLSLTEIGYDYIVRTVREGQSENEIAAELEYYLKKHGVKRTSFNTIVASGTRAAMPHGEASGKKLEKGEVVLFDFGIFQDGYCSDFTRCYSFDKMYASKMEEIRRIVLDALEAAEAAIRPGVEAKAVHAAAAKVIDAAGYGGCFTHSTGHGVGIDIHELPRISANGGTVLQEGMVFTVEPGIYLPELGGVRLEDMVLVTKTGAEVLTVSGYEF